MGPSVPMCRVAIAFLSKCGRLTKTIAVCCLCLPSLAAAPDLTVRGLAIGQNFDQEQLRHLLNKMQCTDEQHCRGYLDILGLSADTKIEGKYHKISDVEVTFNGSQYRYVLGSFSGKYGKPILLPDKIFGKGPNFIIESGIAEWRAPHGVVLRLSQDLKIQEATLSLSGPATAADQKSVEEQKAVDEYAAANPRIKIMAQVMGDEIKRILGERQDPQSPEVAKFMNPATPVTDIGDTRVPLHLRLIEQWRRNFFVAGIELAHYAVVATVKILNRAQTNCWTQPGVPEPYRPSIASGTSWIAIRRECTRSTRRTKTRCSPCTCRRPPKRELWPKPARLPLSRTRASDWSMPSAEGTFN